MSKKYKVVYSPAAKEDLRGIASYVQNELKAPQAARSITAKLRSEIRSLDELPYRYALVDWEPWVSIKMRRVPVGNYVIFYIADEENAVVTVTRIFYGGRNIERIVRDSGI